MPPIEIEPEPSAGTNTKACQQPSAAMPAGVMPLGVKHSFSSPRCVPLSFPFPRRRRRSSSSTSTSSSLDLDTTLSQTTIDAAAADRNRSESAPRSYTTTTSRPTAFSLSTEAPSAASPLPAVAAKTIVGDEQIKIGKGKVSVGSKVRAFFKQLGRRRRGLTAANKRD